VNDGDPIPFRAFFHRRYMSPGKRRHQRMTGDAEIKGTKLKVEILRPRIKDLCPRREF